MDDGVGPGDHVVIEVAEKKAEDDSDDGDGDGRRAANDLVGGSGIFAADENDCACDENNCGEEVGQIGEEAEEVDSVVAALDDGVDKRSCQRREGEEAEEQT